MICVHGYGFASVCRAAWRDTELVNSFRVMADPVRRRIVEILASGEHTAGNIAEVLAIERSITRQAVSKHLRILNENGWASVRVEENTRVYGLERDALSGLYYDVAWLKYLWKRRIGERERNDPIPEHSHPFVYRSPKLRKAKLRKAKVSWGGETS